MVGALPSRKVNSVKRHREGTVLYDAGNYKEAIDRFLQASQLYEKVGDFFDASYTLLKAAECSLLLKDYETAVKRFLETAEKASRRGYDRLELCALEYSDDCHRAAGKAECKEVEDIEERIAEVKKKLASQTY